MAAGEMSSGEFTEFLRKAMMLSRQSSQPGSLAYYFMDWRHMKQILAAGLEVHGEMMNLCVWAKSNAGMGSFYRSAHELIFLFKSGTASHRNNAWWDFSGRGGKTVRAWRECPHLRIEIWGADLVERARCGPPAPIAHSCGDCMNGAPDVWGTRPNRSVVLRGVPTR
jgi:hypothetical protein